MTIEVHVVVVSGHGNTECFMKTEVCNRKVTNNRFLMHLIYMNHMMFVPLSYTSENFGSIIYNRAGRKLMR